jgi:adenosine deaminase CECR1
MRPDLLEIVKKENICIECCPVSNKVLGYVRDLRTHPTRSLLAHGVKVSISPDDPGFFDAPGATLDYLYAYLCWDLNLNDLKQLCLNSIEFASIEEKDKV